MTVKQEIRIRIGQKKMMKKLADKQGITVTNLIMKGLYHEFEKEGLLMDFLNVLDDKEK